jgi:hypothetical protein
MEQAWIERAKDRLTRAFDPAATDAALERARDGVEALAQATAELEAGLPDRVEEAIRSGVRNEAAPIARQLAEVRGLQNQLIRRLERLETELVAERNARVDDLALLVDLVSSGWGSIDERLGRIERHLGAADPAPVLRLEDRQTVPSS